MKTHLGITILSIAILPIAAFALNPPGDLAVTAMASNEVRLTWLDKSTNETGFAIERATSVTVNVFTEIARVAIDATQWTDTNVSAKNTFTYRVFSYNANATSDYSNVASAVTPAKPADAWDPGDDRGPGGAFLAAPRFAEQTHGPHILSAADSYDWFKIFLTNGLTYNFSNARGTSNLLAELYTDSAGFFRVSSDDHSGGNGLFSLTYTVNTTAWHYLRVRTTPVGEEANYDLHYREVIASKTDTWDTNDNSSVKATFADLTNTVEWTHGPHTLSDVDTADWFRVLLTNNVSYVLTTSEGYGDTYAELFSDSNGFNRVAFDDDSGPGSQFRITYTPGSFTSFWLKVVTYPGVTNAAYYLRVSREYDAWDLNDGIIGNSTPLTPPTSLTREHGPHRVSPLSFSDNADWFQVTLDAGVAYNFNSIGGNGDPYIQLFSNNTIVASDNDSGGNGQFSLSFSNRWGAGTFNLRIQSETGLSEYILSYSRGDDAWDTNDDTQPVATALPEPPLSETRHGPHVLSVTDTNDWFSFPLVKGKKYYFESTDAKGDTFGGLYDNFREKAATDDDSGGGTQFRIAYTPSNSATYFLRVHTYEEGETASYSLSYSRSIDGDEDGIPDDWEIDRLGSVTNSNGGADDFDGDSVPDYNEYIADTDPDNTNDYLHLAFIGGDSGTNRTLKWSSSSNRIYALEHAAFPQGFEPVNTNIAAVPPENTYTAAAPDNLHFYRLKVSNLTP